MGWWTCWLLLLRLESGMRCSADVYSMGHHWWWWWCTLSVCQCHTGSRHVMRSLSRPTYTARHAANTLLHHHLHHHRNTAGQFSGHSSVWTADQCKPFRGSGILTFSLCWPMVVVIVVLIVVLWRNQIKYDLICTITVLLQSLIIFSDLDSPQMLEEVIKASNETIFLTEEQYVLVVDLFIFRPELQLEVTGLSVFCFSQLRWHNTIVPDRCDCDCSVHSHRLLKSTTGVLISLSTSSLHNTF